MNGKKLGVVIAILIVIAAVAALVVVYKPPSSFQKTSTSNTHPSTNVPRTAAPITTPNPHIHFQLNPGNPVSCGLTCRKITATLINAGDETAHDVRIILNIYNNAGDNIYSIQESIGDLAGGQSISKTETINVDCGLFASNCIGHMPFTLRAEILFEEGTQTFPDKQFSG